MLDRYLKDEAAVQRMRALPVGSHVDTFAAILSALGYARDSIRDRLWTLAALGRWLTRRGLSVVDLRPDIVAAFLRPRKQRARVHRGAAATLRLFLEYLEQHAVIPPAPSSNSTPIDGTCAFCEGAVKFIATRDPQGHFRFGASQTDKATALLASCGMTRQAARSLSLIEHGQIYLRSTASLRIARRLRWSWSLLGGLLIIPRPLRDLVYRLVAAIRHQLAGRSNACEIPPPEIRARLI